MSTVEIVQDGVTLVVDSADPRAPVVVPTVVAPQTVFAPADLMTKLFTPSEQVGFASRPQGVLFIGLIAAHQNVDITSAEFKADIAQAVAGEFLTQARADQVLAGISAPLDAEQV